MKAPWRPCTQPIGVKLVRQPQLKLFVLPCEHRHRHAGGRETLGSGATSPRCARPHALYVSSPRPCQTHALQGSQSLSVVVTGRNHCRLEHCGVDHIGSGCRATRSDTKSGFVCAKSWPASSMTRSVRLGSSAFSRSPTMTGLIGSLPPHTSKVDAVPVGDVSQYIRPCGARLPTQPSGLEPEPGLMRQVTGRLGLVVCDVVRGQHVLPAAVGALEEE